MGQQNEEQIGFLRKLARLYNPRYQFRKIKEDLVSAITALKHWHFDHSHEYEVLAKSFRGKLFAAFFVSGLFVWPGIALSWWVQAVTRSTLFGTIAMLVFTQIACTTAYQVLWYFGNRELYRLNYTTHKERFLALQRDILPVQWKGFRMILPVVAVTYPVVAWVTHLIAEAIPGAIQALPAGGIAFLVELLLISTPLMRAMGDLFESHGKRLAAKYVVSSQAAR